MKSPTPQVARASSSEVFPTVPDCFTAIQACRASVDIREKTPLVSADRPPSTRAGVTSSPLYHVTEVSTESRDVDVDPIFCSTTAAGADSPLSSSVETFRDPAAPKCCFPPAFCGRLLISISGPCFVVARRCRVCPALTICEFVRLSCCCCCCCCCLLFILCRRAPSTGSSFPTTSILMENYSNRNTCSNTRSRPYWSKFLTTKRKHTSPKNVSAKGGHHQPEVLFRRQRRPAVLNRAGS